MGIGRAVYESTNKAIFADFFPGEKSAGAEGINGDQPGSTVINVLQYITQEFDLVRKIGVE